MIKLKLQEKSVRETLKYFDNFAKRKQGQIVLELRKSAVRIESEAKRNTPVDTGRLRSSIHSEYAGKEGFHYSDKKGNGFNGGLSTRAQGLQILVGTNVEYAALIEYGGKGKGPRPYLFPAFLRDKPKVIDAIFKILQRG